MGQHGQAEDSWPVAHVGKECCAGSNCDQSVRYGAYISFAACQAECARQGSCIAIEYGNLRSDGLSRCQSNGQCACYITTGECTDQKTHLGYSVYLKPGTGGSFDKGFDFSDVKKELDQQYKENKPLASEAPT